jgi:hypothetical protein
VEPITVTIFDEELIHQIVQQFNSHNHLTPYDFYEKFGYVVLSVQHDDQDWCMSLFSHLDRGPKSLTIEFNSVKSLFDLLNNKGTKMSVMNKTEKSNVVLQSNNDELEITANIIDHKFLDFIMVTVHNDQKNRRIILKSMNSLRHLRDSLNEVLNECGVNS